MMKFSKTHLAFALIFGGILLNAADAYLSGKWQASLGVGPTNPDGTNFATTLNNFLPIPLGTSMIVGGAVLIFA